MKEAFCSSFKVAIGTCTENTLVLISDSDYWDIFGRLQIFRANIFCDSSACAKNGNNGKWHRLHVSRPFQSIVGAAAPVGPQFYQWTITVSVHGYLFQEVRDWISNWREVVFVRKRLFFSILSPVNDHSSKKEKDGTFRL